MTQALRNRYELRAKRTALQHQERPETPADDRGVYGLNTAGLRYDGKLAALNWLLDEPRSEVDVYHEYQERRSMLTTADRTGAEATATNDGYVEMLRWALQSDDPTHPRTLHERLERLERDVYQLDEYLRVTEDIPLSDSSHNPDAVDTDFLAETVASAYEALADAHQHLNSPEETARGE